MPNPPEWNFDDFLRYYVRMGFSIIPVAPWKKKPLVRWRECPWRDRPVPSWVLGLWLRLWSGPRPANVAVICGEPSGHLVVIDWDDPDVFPEPFDYDKLVGSTLVWRTGRGYQAAFRLTGSVRSVKIPALGMEVRCHASLAMLPPSVHPSGRVYEFISDPRNISQLPIIDRRNWDTVFWDAIERRFGKEVLEGVFNKGLNLYGPFDSSKPYRRKHPPCFARLLQPEKPIPEGIRNECAIRLASYLIVWRGWKPERALLLLKRWNRKFCAPPLPEKEVEAVVKSVVKHGYRYGCRGMRELNLCPVEERYDPMTGEKKVSVYCPVYEARRRKEEEFIKTVMPV